MMDDEFGTLDERIAVRDACIALREFNARLNACRRLSIECTLTKDGIITYSADFRKFITILLGNEGDLTPSNDDRTEPEQTQPVA